MLRYASAVCLFLSACVAIAAPLKGKVDSPAAGVICDRKAGFCADSQGISAGLTKEYLGDQAGQKITEIMREDFDATTFTLTDGVHCDCKAQKCTVSKYDDKVDAAHTTALFGSAGAAGASSGGGGKLKGAVFSPAAGILCDKKSGICADSQGISMAFTQEYLGEAAQKKQMALMHKGGYNDKYFVLSDGVACNIADKKCYVREGDSKVSAAHTKALFSE